MGATATPGPAQTIGINGGNAQNGTVGSPLQTTPSAICLDAYGNPSAHAEVDWVVLSGGGSVPYAYSLTETGVASKVVTLGKVPGANKISATIHGTNKSVTFTETGSAGAVAKVVITSGNGQTGKAGQALAKPFMVTATDKYGNAKTGVKITWTAGTSGDSLSAGSSVTNQSGTASSTLTLGSSFGLHQATAKVGGTSILQTFTATEGANALVTIQDNPDPNPKALKPFFLGLSYPKNWLTSSFFSTNNTALVALFKKLGPGVLRIVAEKPTTPIIWDKGGPGLVYGTVSQKDLARVAAFLKAVDWKMLYGVALPENTAANAASEAQVVTQEFGSSLLGLEIGNEPDSYEKAVYGDPAVPQIPGYTWQDYISTTPAYSSSGALLPSWPAFASTIQKLAPNAPLTGPTAGFAWATDFSKSNQSSRVSLLTRHYYMPGNSNPTITALFTPDSRVPEQFPELAEEAAAAGISGGYRISECNTFSNATPGVTDSFAAALWTIDFLFANALYQSSGVNFHGGGHGSGNFSPIFDNSGKVVGIGPDYYGLLAYSLLAKGGTLMTTQVSQSPASFSAYAVEETDGSTDVILSNKDPNNSVTVGVAPQGSISEATSLLLTAPSLSATTGFKLGGSPVNIDGSWEATSNPSLPIHGNWAVVTVPAASAQIVHMD